MRFKRLWTRPGIDAPENGPVNGVEVVVQAGPEAGREGAHHCRTPLVGGIEFLAGVADERGRGPTDNSSPARFLRERIIDAAEPGVHERAHPAKEPRPLKPSNRFRISTHDSCSRSSAWSSSRA